ncbi:MAG: GAF domain-containing protein [Chloroflexi bacterium]|nr:GAF domain-containing protein [Chloroflexota bacterium]
MATDQNLAEGDTSSPIRQDIADKRTFPRDDERDILLRISRDLASAQGRDELLQTMTDAALRIVPTADKCVVHLLNDCGSRLVPVACSQPTTLPPDPGMPADVGIAGRSLRERRLINVGDVQRSPDFVPLSSGPELRSLLVAPLHVGEECLGTLSLSSSRQDAFCAADCEHIQVLAAQASVAIRQAQLLHEANTQRERSQAIVSSVSEGLAVLDGEGRVCLLNPAFCQMLDLAPQSLALPCPTSEIPGLRELLPSPECIIGPFEATALLPSGRQITVHVTAARLQSEERSVVIAARDATEERRAAEARALFISQVAHELRTPLQHVLSFVSLLTDLNDLADGERERFLNHIEHETRRLGRLVNDLVILSRIETGQFTTWLEKVDICALVQSVASRLHAYARLLDLELLVACPEEPRMLITDPARVEQVLVNLVDNAFKHVPPGGEIYIRVDTSAADAVLVEVQDNGPGIPAHELPFLFDSFYQASASRNKRTGMGLGLYISRQIVEALGGSIWVQSELGVGSTFAFRLPTLGE